LKNPLVAQGIVDKVHFKNHSPTDWTFDHVQCFVLPRRYTIKY
jgi:hypothetical protein